MSTRPAAPTADVSHGRGGAGNIHPDDTQYVDGSVVREGVEGSHGDGAYSSGRGGAGNIGDKGVKAAPTGRADKDHIPDEAIRGSTDVGDHHTGRGGLGNEERVSKNGVESGITGNHEISLADKLKNKLFGKK